jgi:hypothetical protein
MCSTREVDEIIKGDLFCCISRVELGVDSACARPAGEGLKGFAGGEGGGDVLIGGTSDGVGDGGGGRGGILHGDGSGSCEGVIACSVGGVVEERILTNGASIYCTTNDKFELDGRVGIVGDAGSRFDIGGVEFEGDV